MKPRKKNVKFAMCDGCGKAYPVEVLTKVDIPKGVFMAKKCKGKRGKR